MEIRTPKPLDTLWMKAAVVGSLWASVEIILGSFLHNLKVPMSGTALAFISVYLLIAFAQVWRERGLIWRAGLICALMKSISPSAVIIGPMVGIFTEAVLLEIFILLLGRNTIGYLVGGAFAVFSTILHKAVSLLILYGFDLIRILEELYKFAAKQIRMEDVSPKYLLIAVGVIYLIAGSVAGALGMRAGRRYLSEKPDAGEEIAVNLQAQNKLFAESSKQHYSLLFLLANVAAVALGLFLINFNRYLPATVFCAAYVIFVMMRYKNSVRHFRKVYLWAQFVLITLVAAFLWNGFAKGVFFSTDGLVVGLKMTGRAVLIITGFAAVGVELRNPLIKSILYDRRLSNLYQSLSLAFSVLPHILSSQPKAKEALNKESLTFRYLFRQAEGLLQFLEKEHQNRPTIFVVTGEVRQGKTTFTRRLIELLRAEGCTVGGFLALGVHDAEGQRIGFDLYDIQSGTALPLCTTTPQAGSMNIGNYYFHADTVERGRALLSEPEAAGAQLIVIDELGPLELSNRGWSDAVEALIRNSSTPQLWVVRKPLVEKMIKKWNVGRVYIFDVGQDAENEAAAHILEATKK